MCVCAYTHFLSLARDECVDHCENALIDVYNEMCVVECDEDSAVSLNRERCVR